MGCNVTMTVLSEHQEGYIGDDWKYTITVKAFNEGLKGMGAIDVPKHALAGDTPARLRPSTFPPASAAKSCCSASTCLPPRWIS